LGQGARVAAPQPGHTIVLASLQGRLMPLIVGDHGLNRRNLDDFMTKGRGGLAQSGHLTAATRLRLQDQDLLDFFYWIFLDDFASQTLKLEFTR
jgi:hypothetical protein